MTLRAPTAAGLRASASFDKDGEDPPGVSTGILSLYHGARRSVRAASKTQPGMFSLAGEAVCVGPDSGDPYVDLEREAQAVLARE